ncbi:response regulator [Sulfurimonas sp.]|nr:response regulator [Sulfurimonas sp.]
MNNKIILLVEDNADDEALTIRALKKNNLANKIDIVRDGAEAIDYIFCKGEYSSRDINDKPQLILLDLNLPKMNGIDVLKHIRSEEVSKHIPVVMLTTSEQEDDITKSYDVGANSFIRKPVDFTEFTEVVNQLGVYWMAINKAAKV